MSINFNPSGKEKIRKKMSFFYVFQCINKKYIYLYTRNEKKYSHANDL